MLIVGTSAVVHPAASFGLLARRAGAFVAEINRSRTPQSSFFDVSIQGKAGEVLPELVRLVAG
jgi:NAD-dependent deacetylase